MEAANEGGFYSILGVSPKATVDAIRIAYEMALSQNDPNKVPSSEREEAEKKIDLIENVYACLSDDWKRYCYDYFGLERYVNHQKAVEKIEILLSNGISVYKHSRKGFLPSRRFLWISADSQWLLIGKTVLREPSADALDALKQARVSDVIEVTRGLSTKILERSGKSRNQGRCKVVLSPARVSNTHTHT